jgi:ribosomal protein S18 acetylase RimI-like enzyme
VSFIVRRLEGADAALYREIRLEGLRTDPASFGATLEDDAAVTEDGWRSRLEQNFAAGVFEGEELLGIAGFIVERGAKVKHRGHVVGVYVREAARGRGAAGPLLAAVIEAARPHVTFLYLQVTQQNTRAVRFYERAGFTIYGRDPGGLVVDGTMYEDYLMMLRLH